MFFVYFHSVPPQKPVIYDARRRDRTKLIEPYNEGSDVTLICEVSGGKFKLDYDAKNCKISSNENLY